MKKFSFCFLLLGGIMSAQNTYIDPSTMAMLKLYSDNLKSQQNKTIEQQTKLQKAQAFVATQMVTANNIQNKIYKGLSEVSGSLDNGMQAKEIYYNLKQIVKISNDISKLIKEKPAYSIFGVKATEKAYTNSIRMGAEIASILKSGELNLMTAGDRSKLLSELLHDVKMFKIYLLTIQNNLERAHRLGFWKSINPFQRYINTDEAIVRDVMRKYKRNF